MFLSPSHLIEKLNITKGSTVVDFGAGSGAYIYPSLRAASETGKVIAVDIDGEMLKTVESTSRVAGHTLHILRANLEDKIILPDYTADYIICANVLHQIENKDLFVKEMRRILSPRGALLFVEWKVDSRFGPAKSHKIKEETAVALLEGAGFSLVETLPAGDYHYAYTLKV
jgi:ubiquinone/menaquinone biosynthesis C-methylase UbiE